MENFGGSEAEYFLKTIVTTLPTLFSYTFIVRDCQYFPESSAASLVFVKKGKANVKLSDIVNGHEVIYCFIYVTSFRERGSINKRHE